MFSARDRVRSAGKPASRRSARCAGSFAIWRALGSTKRRLIWLPEADQRVVNILCREIHVELYRLQEPLSDGAVPRLASKGSARLYYARTCLVAREEAAASRLGSSKPSDLAEALLQLPPAIRARQSVLLAGLRTLPRGRFFEGDEDVYPMIVGVWSQSSAAAARPAQ